MGINFMGPLLMSSIGHNYAITFTDYLTRQIRTVPIRCDDVNTLGVQHLAKIYFTQVFWYHWLPSGVHTDCGAVFTSAFWTGLLKLCGTSVRLFTVYHPQTQGLTERANSTMFHSL